MAFIILSFILSVFLLIHTYFIFPWHMRSTIRKQTWNQQDVLPFVSIILSAYNEEDFIEEKINTTLNTDYPSEKIEILVGSDASTDGTSKLLQQMERTHSSLQFFDFEERRGKPEVVNELVGKATGEILIMTDADTFFEKSTIPELLKPFGDEQVGGVQGVILSEDDGHKEVYLQEKGYNEGEFEVKHGESMRETVIGAHGACYAIRKSLFVEVPKENPVDDFFIFMKVLEQGYKTVLSKNAICRMMLSGNAGLQFRRKVRMASGNYKNLIEFKALLNPAKGFLAYAFLSHKVLRWLGPFLLIIACLSNLLLINESGFFEITFFLQTGFYLIALFDFVIGRKIYNWFLPRLISHFCLMNLAFLVGAFNSWFSKGNSIWHNRGNLF